jgi:hypothetical protein
VSHADSPNPQLDRVQRRSLIVGMVGLALCLAGAFLSREQFFRSYLLGYLFWIGIALGSCAIVMLHHLAGGAWGFVIRRLLESGARTLPLMAALFVPLLFGLHDLYLWARTQEVAGSELLRHKRAYLNTPFFLIRTAVYFAAWIGLAHLLNKWSGEQDQTSEPSPTRRLQSLSGPGLVVYGLTMTFASIDWVMSLEPEWFSTMYGIMFIVGQVLATMAFMIAVAVLLSDRRPLSDVASAAHFHDLGNLLLAFVMIWAYIAFAQFLIVWSGNLPEEIPWYLHRTQGGWQWIALLLAVFHFAVPFALLLSRGTKRRLRTLATVAGAIILMRLVDLFWLVVPAFHPAGPRLHWMDLAAPVGIGGIWIAAFLSHLKGRPLLPLHDPSLREAFSLEEHGG